MSERGRGAKEAAAHGASSGLRVGTSGVPTQQQRLGTPVKAATTGDTRGAAKAIQERAQGEAQARANVRKASDIIRQARRVLTTAAATQLGVKLDDSDFNQMRSSLETAQLVQNKDWDKLLDRLAERDPSLRRVSPDSTVRVGGPADGLTDPDTRQVWLRAGAPLGSGGVRVVLEEGLHVLVNAAARRAGRQLDLQDDERFCHRMAGQLHR